jgi:hypothetical protein
MKLKITLLLSVFLIGSGPSKADSFTWLGGPNWEDCSTWCPPFDDPRYCHPIFDPNPPNQRFDGANFAIGGNCGAGIANANGTIQFQGNAACWAVSVQDTNQITFQLGDPDLQTRLSFTAEFFGVGSGVGIGGGGSLTIKQGDLLAPNGVGVINGGIHVAGGTAGGATYQGSIIVVHGGSLSVTDEGSITVGETDVENATFLIDNATVSGGYLVLGSTALTISNDATADFSDGVIGQSNGATVPGPCDISISGGSSLILRTNANPVLSNNGATMFRIMGGGTFESSAQLFSIGVAGSWLSSGTNVTKVSDAGSKWVHHGNISLAAGGGEFGGNKANLDVLSGGAVDIQGGILAGSDRDVNFIQVHVGGESTLSVAEAFQVGGTVSILVEKGGNFTAQNISSTGDNSQVGKLTLGGEISSPIQYSGILSVNSSTHEAIVDGNFTHSGILNIHAQNSDSGLSCDVLRVRGEINLSGTLNFDLPSTTPENTSFVILDNEGAGPIKGSFIGLPQWGTFTENGLMLRVDYRAGDGNDVGLTVISPRTLLILRDETGKFVLLTMPGVSVELEASEDLINWTSIPVTNTGGVLLTIDSNDPTALSQRFLRTLVSP